MNNIPEMQYDNKSMRSSALQLNFFSELLADGYDLRLQVTGNSMSPFLASGSYVTLSGIPVSELKIGDIIFCRCSGGAFKLHRLIQIDSESLITKGDALISCDLPFSKSDYKGKVVGIEHHCVNGVIKRNMEKPSARIKNYLIARYYQWKLFFIRIYIRLKANPA